MFRFAKNFKLDRAPGYDDTTIEDVRKQREMEHRLYLYKKRRIILFIAFFIVIISIMYFVIKWEVGILNEMRGGEVTNNSDDVPLINIDLSASKVEININEELKIDVIYTPENASDKSVSWESSNQDVASINEDGIVKGLKEGETIITARGSNGKKGTIRIMVK